MRIAGTLTARDYLIYDAEERRYRLGVRLLVLGKRFENTLDLAASAQPLLQQLADATGETASLFGINDCSRVVLGLAHGSNELRHALAVGDQQVLVAGASGKVLLAYSPPALAERALLHASKDPAFRSRLPTAPELAAELGRIREQGYAESYGERNPQVAAIAAPVFDEAGRIVGAFGVSGALAHFSGSFVPETSLLVVRLAAELTRLIGRAPNGRRTSVPSA